MLNTVKRYIIANHLIKPGERVIVAVSGGPDSMALLHVLKTLAPEMAFELLAAHVNHGLRPEANAEAHFVADQCQEWKIPCHTEVVNVRALAREEKTSLEDAGRRARYRFFYALLAEQGASSIATAHHRDDVAETVLLHLLRGSGMQGLRGILPRNGQLIRPLLLAGKEQLLDYLNGNQVQYCLDQSNDNPDFARNRIRHQLIPLLKQDYNPRIVENLNRLADIVRAENEFLENEMEQYWSRVIKESASHTIEFDHQLFSSLPLAARRRLVMRAFNELSGSAGWEANDVEKVLELSEKPGSSKVLKLKKKLRVNKSYDKMIFTKRWLKPENFCLNVTVPGGVDWPDGTGYHFTIQEASGYDPNREDIYLDYDQISLPLVLRSRREGDVIQPLGFSGHKRLKKYLIDQKVPCRERELVPVLASRDGEIYAVLGYLISQTAAVNSSTRTILVIKKT